MFTLTVRNIESATKDKLSLAAAAHGRIMEEEVRSILRAVLSQSGPPGGLGSRIHARFVAQGGIELEVLAWLEAQSEDALCGYRASWQPS